MKKLAILAVVAVLVGLPGLASANSVTYNAVDGGIPTTLTDWGITTPVYLNFKQFSTTLGTLTKVDLHLDSDLNTDLVITNHGAGTSTGSVKTEIAISVRDFNNKIPSTPQIDHNFPFPPFAYSIGSNEHQDTGIMEDSVSSDNSYTNSILLGEFTGNSSITLKAFTFTQAWLSTTNGNTDVSQTSHASLTGTVTYEYTAAPVPAPPTLLLLGSGLVGLLALRRRRKKVSKS